MYSKGDLIVYGNAGVYKVEDITTLKGVSYAEKNKEYYILKPLFSEGVVYYPVDSDKIFTRPIISKEEVERIITLIPEIESKSIVCGSVAELTEHYKSVFATHSCEDLVKLLMSIYQKKQLAKEQNRKLGQIDETYLRQAENQLYSEFAAALGIDKSEVEEYIRTKVEN